jgi:hypothetical protein
VRPERQPREGHGGDERRSVFQLWTTFAVAWPVVFVLTGSWIFLALAGGFLVLAGLAAVALRVLTRFHPNGT